MVSISLLKIKNVAAELTVHTLIIALSSLAGWYLLFLNFQGLIDFGNSTFSVWNKRLLVMFAVALICVPIALIRSNWSQIRRLKWFFIAFGGILLLLFVALGGFVGGFDAYNSGNTMNVNTVWVAFDSSGGDTPLFGINFSLVANAIVGCVVLVLVIIGIIQIYYAGEADEYVKAVFELFTAMIAIVVYAMWVAPNLATI